MKLFIYFNGRKPDNNRYEFKAKIRIMKNLLFLTLIIISIGCNKADFDIENPDVEKFVQEIKEGSYDNYHIGKNKEQLWLLMPSFTEKHIPLLIKYATDTTHLNAYPINPASSRMPYPKGYAILGECLLWTVEGIRNGKKYGSLDPFLIDNSKDEKEKLKGINGKEVMQVQETYKKWWNEYQSSNWRDVNPLEKTTYLWF